MFSVHLHVTEETSSSTKTTVYNVLGDGQGHQPPLPTTALCWPGNVALSLVKQSQIGPFLTTERVTLDPKLGMLVSANYTVAYANTRSMYCWLAAD